MNGHSNQNPRRLPGVPNERGVTLTIGVLNESMDVSLIEIAPTECKFVSDRVLKWGTPVSCELHCEDENFRQHLSGRVHWARFVKDSWQIGIVFGSPLAPVFCYAMGNDSRSSLRYEVQQGGTINLEGAGPIPIVIQDYSMNGCSFIAPLEAESLEGRVFDLAINEESIVSGRIIWQSQLANRQVLAGAQLSGMDLSWFVGIGLQNGSDDWNDEEK